MEARPTVEELGAKLRAARLAQGLSLAELQARTCIRPQFLEAIEQGEFHRIPGEVYLKGFLRSYAAEVGLDPDEIVAEYRALRGDDPIRPWQRLESVPPDYLRGPLRGLPPVRRARRRGLGSKLALAFLVLVTVGVGVVVVRPQGGGWSEDGGLLRSRVLQRAEGLFLLADRRADFAAEGERGAVRGAAEASAMAESARPEPLGKGSSPGTAGREASLNGSPDGGGSRSVSLPPPNWEAAWQLSPADGAALSRDARGDGTPPRSAGPVRLRAVAVDEAWAEVAADGLRVFRGALLPGDEMVWEGREVLSVRLERAEGVRLYLNGVELGTVGEGTLEREFRAPEIHGQIPSDGG